MTRHLKTILLLHLMLVSASISAQRFYAVSGDVLLKVNLTPNGGISTPVKMCAPEHLFSIALYKDTLYHLRNEQLFRSILRGSELVGCEQVATLPIISPTSLTVDSTGVLYMAGEKLFYTYNLHTGQFDSLGVLPYESAGEFIFFKGSLYMASRKGIVKIDLTDLANSKLIIPFSEGIFGLASLSLDCKENKMYAFSINVNRTTDVIELDLDQHKINGTVATLPYIVLDAASNVEGGNLADIPLNNVEVSPMCKDAPKAQANVVMEPGITPYMFSVDGGSKTTNPLFTGLLPGLHTLSISTANGCRIDTSFSVPVYDINRPAIKASLEDVNCAEGGKVWFTAPPDTTIVRTLFGNDTLPLTHVFDKLRGGEYPFKFIDQNNCLLDSMTVTLSNTFCDTVYFPGAFTPNSDNKNDVFRSAYNYSIRNYKLTIFNRFGIPLFTTSAQEKGWDGTFKGKEQGTGAYVWIATYTNLAGERIMRKGVVILLR